jgi:hypothetical protein
MSPRRITLENVFSSPPVYANAKLCYTAHATVTYSVAQAIDILDIIGKSTDSDDCLPFAMNIVDDGEVVSVGEDNGEFGIGELLAKSLQDLHGFNTLICVSRKVSGVYVTEMMQHVKSKIIKQAVTHALGELYQHLVKRENEREQIDDMRREQATSDNNHNNLTLSSKNLLHLGSTNNSIISAGDDEASIVNADTDGTMKKKARPRGSGPNGRETIFERTERQARERHEREMQILQAKKILQANRPLFVPKTRPMTLPEDLKVYDPNEGRNLPSPRDNQTNKKNYKKNDKLKT